jgi:hypothetical protein
MNVPAQHWPLQHVLVRPGQHVLPHTTLGRSQQPPQTCDGLQQVLPQGALSAAQHRSRAVSAQNVPLQHDAALHLEAGGGWPSSNVTVWSGRTVT